MTTKHDLNLEFAILKTLCGSDLQEVRTYLLPRLNQTHFASQTTQNLYRRITKVLEATQYIPTWEDLSIDPGVRKETRQAMKDVDVRRLKSADEIRSSFSNLDTYRKIRALYHLGANLEAALEEPAIDLSKIMENLTKDIQVAMDGSQETPITNIGVGGNANEMVKKLLRTGGPPRVSTGFGQFDNKNKGFPRGAFVLMGATTGAGKSVMASMLSENFAMQGAQVGFVPLEMNAEETTQRNLARIAQEPLGNLIDPENKLTDQRRREIYKAYKIYQERIEKRGGRIATIEPKFDCTMYNLLDFVKPMGLDVLIIDYIGLLSGVNGADQWRILSEVTAFAKRWAEINQCIVIGLVQITAELAIRYSAAMQEHASYAWFWTRDQLAKDTNIIEINQVKCRQGEMFPFYLKYDFSLMQMRDATEQELEEYLSFTKPGSGNHSGESKWKNKGKEKKRKYEDADDTDDTEPPKGSKKFAKPKPRDPMEF
jgi:replicative DNA helicase